MGGFRLIEVAIKLVIFAGFIWGVICFLSYLGIVIDSTRDEFLGNSKGTIKYEKSDVVPHGFSNMAYEYPRVNRQNII